MKKLKLYFDSLPERKKNIISVIYLFFAIAIPLLVYCLIGGLPLKLALPITLIITILMVIGLIICAIGDNQNNEELK